MPAVKKTTLNIKKPKGGGGVVDRIAPVSLLDKRILINVYGKSGSGKTTLACTFPKPLLLVGTEDGTKSIYNVQGVDFVRIYDPDELGEIQRHVQEGGKYKSVVLDNATGLQDLQIKAILGLDEVPVQKSWGMASQSEWGQCAIMMKERLRGLLGLPTHVVVIAQERAFNVDEGANEVLLPSVASALSPSVAGWLNGAVDYICETFLKRRTESVQVKIGKKTITKNKVVKGVDYCLRTGPDDVYTTKFRVPRGTTLPEFIINPDFESIHSILTAAMKEGK